MMGRKFKYDAVDILIREEVKVIASYFGLGDEQSINLYQANSLELLPQLDTKYQLILLDGDHNFYTVSRELELLNRNNCLSDTVMIIDDYHGRWADKDLFYSTREDYEKVSTATRPVETEKHGVRPAVDEFCEKYPEWQRRVLMKGEPIVLHRENKDDF